MANSQYHPIPSSRPQSKRPKRTAATALDWNQPKRQPRTPKSEYAFLLDYPFARAGQFNDRERGGL